MKTRAELEAEFHEAMLHLYTDAKKLGVYATRFRNEVNEYGGVDAARRFLSKGNPWDAGQLEGVTLLIDADGGIKNLQYTAEALMLQPRFSSLFTEEERKKACRRLKDLDPSW